MKANFQKSDEFSVRRLPVGAEVLPTGGVHFRVWSPGSNNIAAMMETAAGRKASVELENERNGYFSGLCPEASAGDLYRFCLNGREEWLPDPASRFQPEGPLGPSMVIDPGTFSWRDSEWRGARPQGQVIYEMHIGAFTCEGTWKAASEQLPALKELGITLLEIMPVHDFCGRYGWGYDGVDFFAPTRLYGTPDDFRSFVNRAHGLGLGVVLDVVYNHAGPAGNYLKEFSPDYFTDRYSTDWGEPFNFDGPNSAPVREFFTANAGYWIEEFHLDGLRLDATQNVYDASESHILAEITERARLAAGDRSILTIGENEPQNIKLIHPMKEGGYGMDALWNDDFHHSALVALTGRQEAYYSDYRGSAQEFVSAAKWGFLYQGQYYRWQQQRRGTSTYGLRPAAFIHYLENHDQIANLGLGRRIHQLSHPGAYRAMTALLLLSPQTPMLFQGQEFAASSPFTFFADHPPELAASVKKGRFEFLRQFRSLASAKMRSHLPDPIDPETFEACRLDFSEREQHPESYNLHCDLLRLRREDPVFGAEPRGGIDGAVLGDQLFVLRFFGGGDDRLLLVNLGIDVDLSPVPEPLLAPPENMRWRLMWSSEDPRYGGSGASPSENVESWLIPGKGAFVLEAVV